MKMDRKKMGGMKKEDGQREGRRWMEKKDRGKEDRKKKWIKRR